MCLDTLTDETLRSPEFLNDWNRPKAELTGRKWARAERKVAEPSRKTCYHATTHVPSRMKNCVLLAGVWNPFIYYLFCISGQLDMSPLHTKHNTPARKDCLTVTVNTPLHFHHSIPRIATLTPLGMALSLALLSTRCYCIKCRKWWLWSCMND